MLGHETMTQPFMTTARESRIVMLLVMLSALLCVYAQRQVDPDLYGYLAYGRLFVEHGGPVSADPFGYTSQAHSWVTFEYLSQILLWLTYDLFGAVGLIGLKMILGGAAILF